MAFVECCICWGDLKDDPAAVSVPPQTKKPKMNPTNNAPEVVCLPCGHVFHKACLISWFTTQHPNAGQKGTVKHGTCPTCRDKVDEDEFYPLYFSYAKNPTGSPSNTIPIPKTYNTSSSTNIDKSQKDSSKSSSASSPLFPFPWSSCTTSSGQNLPQTPNQTPSSRQITCQETSCQDLQMRFNLLEKDYHEVSRKLAEERERADLNQAIINSTSDSPSSGNSDKSSDDSEPDSDSDYDIYGEDDF